MLNNFYIYVYFDPTRDLEAFYVGKGKGRRSHCHLTRTDKHPFTHRLQKMARNGVIPLIERYEGLSEQAAFDLEVALIQEIGRKDLGTGSLLNLSDGGEGPSNPSLETRAKISAAAKNISEETRAKMRVAAIERAKNISEETRAKISAARKGRPMSEAQKEKMREMWAKRKAAQDVADKY